MKMWIARDEDGILTLYYGKPILEDWLGMWSSKEGRKELDRDLFPEVTFENSPMKVELKLIEK